MASLSLRAVSTDEYAALRRVIDHGFHEAPDEESAERERELLEFDRTLAAFDGTDVVASAAAYSLDLTVPGGSVPAAGVTWVAVLGTYRRRGVLTSIMRRQLDDIRAAGNEPIATLWASEPAIYGQFGYGMAAAELSLTIPRSATALRTAGQSADDSDLRLRMVDTDESIALALPMYDHDRARRPGMFALTEGWQRIRVFTPASMRDGSSPLRAVLVEDDQGVRAYARYQVKAAWQATGPDATVTVRDVHGRDPAAIASIWQFLLDIDLTARVEVRRRPLDDPLVALLRDVRRAQVKLADGLYVRIVDLGAALSARTYAAPVDVVLDVRDDFCGWNAGRWRLSGDATGGRCEPTTDAPQIRLDVRELGAAYLGGTSISALADAGLVTEQSPGAVHALSAAMRHEPLPWCPIVF